MLPKWQIYDSWLLGQAAFQCQALELSPKEHSTSFPERWTRGRIVTLNCFLGMIHLAQPDFFKREQMLTAINILLFYPVPHRYLLSAEALCQAQYKMPTAPMSSSQLPFPKHFTVPQPVSHRPPPFTPKHIAFIVSRNFFKRQSSPASSTCLHSQHLERWFRRIVSSRPVWAMK